MTRCGPTIPLAKLSAPIFPPCSTAIRLATRYIEAFLFYKGFLALQSYRISHWLWTNGRHPMALLFQSRISELFDVDIHPAAVLGRGIMIDHATGVVIGETAVVEDDVSMLHGVTLGGTGKETGDRHPKICRGVLLSMVRRCSAISRSANIRASARARSS